MREKVGQMFTPEQYRAKAAEYAEMIAAEGAPEKLKELQQLHKSFTDLANNEQWLADNYHSTVHAFSNDGGPAAGLAAEEEHILRCLGAALIMRWNTLPRKLRRELFDNAGAMGDLSEATQLRGKIARFLHKHKDDEV
jgi:hypothetical protein